jgi:hypothetical protein
MHLPPTAKESPEMFTGEVYMDVSVRGDEPSRVRVSAVGFTPRARAAWHSPAVGRTLYVTSVHVWSHWSISAAPGGPRPDATWGERVTDEEYRGRG